MLRNNLTTEEHPLGLYHPHAELHHIKKENIGLIEVMGLAVLPARLKDELAAVADALVSGADLRADERTEKHADWAEGFRGKYTYHPGERPGHRPEGDRPGLCPGAGARRAYTDAVRRERRPSSALSSRYNTQYREKYAAPGASLRGLSLSKKRRCLSSRDNAKDHSANMGEER